MGFEKGRHKEVLSHPVRAYGIGLDPEPEYVEPKDPEWGFMVTGYSECIDSFFAFGLFELARRSGFFPEALVETFEPVIQEEGSPHSVLRQLRVLAQAYYAAVAPPLVLRHDAGGLDVLDPRAHRHRQGRQLRRKRGHQFHWAGRAVSGVDIKPAELMDICLAENDRRLAGYDPRLLRPTTVPHLVRFARRFMRDPKSDQRARNTQYIRE